MNYQTNQKLNLQNFYLQGISDQEIMDCRTTVAPKFRTRLGFKL